MQVPAGEDRVTIKKNKNNICRIIMKKSKKKCKEEAEKLKDNAVSMPRAALSQQDIKSMSY